MKKLTAAIVVLSGFMFVLAGCGPADTSLVIGNWYLYSQSYDSNIYTLNTTKVLSVYYADMTVVAYDRSSSSGPYDHTNSGTYTIDANTKELKTSVNGYVNSYTYSFPDNDTMKLIMPSSDEKVFKRW